MAAVLHIISSLDPRAGGTTSALAALAVAQQRAGLAVTVAAPRTTNLRTEATDALTAAGVVVDLIDDGAGRLRSGSAIRRQLNPLMANADIVHIHACWEEIQHQAAVAARRLNKPYLFTPHGMLDPWSLRQSRWKKRLYLALRLRRDLNHAAAIHYADDVERNLVRPLKLRAPSLVEPHVIDLSEFSSLPPAGSFRSRHPSIGERPMVLFLSRVHPKKGLDLLIPAFARQRGDAMLVIAGPAEPDYQASLRRLAEVNGVGDRVLFTGMLYGPDRVAALADADVFTLPSYQENFGMVIIESLAAGTPVIISDQVNIHRQITAAGVGSVVATNIDALQSALGELLNDAVARDAAAARARTFVLEHFDAARSARRWIDHYAHFGPT